MVRKTKEEALVTRSRILDAAERVFQQRGVSGTSLHDIAQAAGVTRGAVYWHFTDKADLFNAMMSRVCLPIEENTSLQAARECPDALAALRQHLVDILARVASEEQMRRVLEVATQKVEYVDEFVAVRERHVQMRNQHIDDLERMLRRAQRMGPVVKSPSAWQLAIGLHALLDGLLQGWLLDPAAFDLKRIGARAVDTHLAGLASARACSDTRSQAVSLR
jgi:TetR/AcrR family acrAB operon transcriptional repressor